MEQRGLKEGSHSALQAPLDDNADKGPSLLAVISSLMRLQSAGALTLVERICKVTVEEKIHLQIMRVVRDTKRSLLPRCHSSQM